MMKPRTGRLINERVSMSAAVNKSDNIVSNGGTSGVVSQRNQAQLLNNQQTSAQVIRKRRSSINVYDQPSSINSRLRQLETDMLRLDEDRTKLFDDTHSALAQYELRLNEIHAILKSRQDNVEKYVEDMKLLLIAKEEFEKQAKLLNEKHDRIHEKFMHRETTISREIKLLKNKFELLEKSRQFKSILQKSNNTSLSDNSPNDLLTGGLDEPLGQNLGLKVRDSELTGVGISVSDAGGMNSSSSLQFSNTTEALARDEKQSIVKRLMKIIKFEPIRCFVGRLLKARTLGNKVLPKRSSKQVSSVALNSEQGGEEDLVEPISSEPLA